LLRHTLQIEKHISKPNQTHYTSTPCFPLPELRVYRLITPFLSNQQDPELCREFHDEVSWRKTRA